jgi:hypothetical protein
MIKFIATMFFDCIKNPGSIECRDFSFIRYGQM